MWLIVDESKARRAGGGLFCLTLFDTPDLVDGLLSMDVLAVCTVPVHRCMLLCFAKLLHYITLLILAIIEFRALSE